MQPFLFDWPAAARYVQPKNEAERTVATVEDNDELLMRRMAAGERPALAALYDRYAALLYAVGRRIVRDPGEAEDLVHDVFLEVWRCAADYDATRASVRAWLLLRMRSRAIDRRKTPRVTRAAALPDESLLEELAGAEDPQLSPDRARVRRALAELPAEQRIVLELGYYEGLSSSEIAARVEIPVGTVKSRVAAALAKLRAGLNSPRAGQ